MKSFNRELITKDQFDELMTKLDVIGKMINGYINSLGDVNDPMGVYLVKTDVPEVDHGIPNA